MKIKIASLKVGTRVAPKNHTSYGVIVKRQGPNLYWVTMTAQGIEFTALMNRNTFSVAPQEGAAL